MVISLIALGIIALATVSAAVVGICYIYQRNRIRKVEEKVRREFMYEQVVLQENYWAAYSALLRVAEEQEKKTQNSAWSRW